MAQGPRGYNFNNLFALSLQLQFVYIFLLKDSAGPECLTCALLTQIPSSPAFQTLTLSVQKLIKLQEKYQKSLKITKKKPKPKTLKMLCHQITHDTLVKNLSSSSY